MYVISGYSCWRAEIGTGELSVMDDLSESRSHFGVCTTGHHIYVAGGETTERFNLLTK